MSVFCYTTIVELLQKIKYSKFGFVNIWLLVIALATILVAIMNTALPVTSVHAGSPGCYLKSEVDKGNPVTYSCDNIDNVVLPKDFNALPNKCYVIDDLGAGDFTSDSDGFVIEVNCLTLRSAQFDSLIQGGKTYDCNGVPTSINVECTPDTNPIFSYLGGIINFLGVGVGVVVVAMVVTGGVQYITSRGVPQQIEAAKKRITNALIALIMFIFMYAFLQWLIPGGLFG